MLFSPSHFDFLSILPFLYLYTTLQRSPGYTAEGHDLRQRMYSTGIVRHILDCISFAGHTKLSKEKEGGKKEGGVSSNKATGQSAR